ncbi:MULTISPECIES: hypothetical protein [Brevibacillus]|jgi:hypothetical protein|uniref:DUF4309 domain-containing protein n=2 Tax=Brevibacillus parabrevis TaxID=54914 RepID=A0A4Y3PK66_BREPA|nr:MULTISPECIES: hypothetical protein [Brevibacillus]MBU8710894.1 hypothetical protein [Brevibacillus parabrevis]MDH6351742.1 hypothetical protein [Brevibacillus sp. 1238]MDR5002163.1 hypothetical protein [Brevibacillus parabrevis]MED2253563.1 hypothetical protein [Brevibacillus parabrevis]NRQ55388.1 hypothetical protein [Brevibacillus sp. HD1.4A]
MTRIALFFCLLALFATSYFLTDDSSPTPLQAIEQMREEVGTVLHEASTDKGTLFFLVHEDGQIHAEFAKKTILGWKWGNGGSHAIPADSEMSLYDPAFSTQYVANGKENPFDSPFPMLFGVILDPAIDSLVVVSDKTGKEIQAEIIDSELIPFRLWYAQIPVKQGEAFTVTALGEDGGVI